MNAYAFVSNDGDIDTDTLSETAEWAKLKALESVMGWRFEYPKRYNRDEAWELLKTWGGVRRIVMTIEEP